jgi:GMP synthase (glutamine-hydrolysing)
MKIHCFQHVPFEGLGCIEDWANASGFRLSLTRFYENDLLPELDQMDWLLVMGGPMGVSDEPKFPWLTREKRLIEKAIQRGKVVLGICLGAQLIADVLGARVYRNQFKEIGWFPIELTEAGQTSSLFGFLPARPTVFHWHGDTFDMPREAVHLAQSEACRNQAFVYKERVIGVQFHLETTAAGIEALVKNCADEIVEGPFIQSPKEMRDHCQEIPSSTRGWKGYCPGSLWRRVGN